MILYLKKQLLAIIVLCSLFSIIQATDSSKSIDIMVKGTTETQKLNLFTIDNKDYIDLDNLAVIFKANVKEERADKRIYLNIYDEQFIFLAHSAFFTFKNNDYKMAYPLLSHNGKYCLPEEFVTYMLPKLFWDKITWNGQKLIIAKTQDNTIKTIVIDPGHGGKDPGAVAKNNISLEKDINLNVSLKLKDLLEKELGVKVLMTRTDDRFVSLQERTKFANENKADLFICVHTNASKDRSSHGIEVYYLSTAKTTEARAVEALENSVVELYEGGKSAVQKYDDLALILSDIMQTETLEQSNNLALKLQMNTCAGTNALNRGIRQANFFVLRGAFMPSVLVEMGFISNSVEEKYLTNQQYQERMARTLFEGIKSFKFRYDRIRST